MTNDSATIPKGMITIDSMISTPDAAGFKHLELRMTNKYEDCT